MTDPHGVEEPFDPTLPWVRIILVRGFAVDVGDAVAGR